MCHITAITSFLSLSLSLSLSNAPHCQPAGRGRGHKDVSLGSSPPTAITCLRRQLNTLSPPSTATLHRFKSHGSARPPTRPGFHPWKKGTWRGSALVWLPTVHMHEWKAAVCACVCHCVPLPYSAEQPSSWPWAACWPPSSCRPWAHVSSGGPKCAGPARRRRWSESGPACWSSAACRTARPAPEHQQQKNKNKKQSHVSY